MYVCMYVCRVIAMWHRGVDPELAVVFLSESCRRWVCTTATDPAQPCYLLIHTCIQSITVDDEREVCATASHSLQQSRSGGVEEGLLH